MWSRLFSKRHVTKIGLRPPRPEAGRAGLAVVLIVRNEARHIGEWARFHHWAGVRRFFVYDNGSEDGTVAAVRAALPSEALVVVPWDQLFWDGRTGREIHNQVLAYAHATRNFGGAFRWMAFIDVDEFLVPMGASDLNGALAHLEVPSVSLPWHMFGRNGHKAAPEGGVLENYTTRAPDPMTGLAGVRNFKTIVDPTKVTALKVHSIEVEGRMVTWNDAGLAADMAGRERPGFYSNAHIQLNHYYTRSDAELRAKIDRGPNLTTAEADHQRRVWRKVENIEAGAIEDRAALDYLERIGRRG